MTNGYVEPRSGSHLDEIVLGSSHGVAKERNFRVGNVFFVVFAKANDFRDELCRLSRFSLGRDEVGEAARGKPENVIDSVFRVWEKDGKGKGV